MAEALYVCDPTPSMSVQRNYVSRRNAGMENAHPFVFQQQLMVGRRRCARVKRIGPRPVFRIRNRILAHAFLGSPSILLKLRHRRLKRARR